MRISSSSAYFVRARARPETRERESEKMNSTLPYLFANHSCVANRPLSLTHRVFLVSFRRFFLHVASSRPSTTPLSFVSSDEGPLFLFLFSRCQNFQLLGLVARRRARASSASLPNFSSPVLRFRLSTSHFVSSPRARRNSRTRTKRGGAWSVFRPIFSIIIVAESLVELEEDNDDGTSSFFVFVSHAQQKSSSSSSSSSRSAMVPYHYS